MTDRRARSSFDLAARLAAGALVALLLGQATASLAHGHAPRVVAGEAAVEGASPDSSSPSPAGHGLLDCRACRLRGELERPATRAVGDRVPRSPALAGRLPAVASEVLHELWRPGSRPARAPPVPS